MPRSARALYRGPVPWWTTLAVIIAAWGWATHEYLAVLLVDFSDTWLHLALIRHTMEYGWFPGDPFYAGMPTPIFYSLGHILFAAASSATGRPPHEIFIASPPWLAMVTVLAMFAWLRSLTGDIRVAVTGAAAELLVQIPGAPWKDLPYPRELAVIPFALALFFYLRGRPNRRLALLCAAGMALGICLSLHLIVGGMCVLSLIFLDLALSPGRLRPSSSLPITGAVGLVVSAPWWINFLHAWALRDGGTASVSGAAAKAWTLSLGPLSLAMYRPDALMNALPWPLWIPCLLGFALTLCRGLTGRADTADRFILISTLSVLALLLTPLYGLLRQFTLVWAVRFLRAIPFSLLIGIGMVHAVDWARSRPSRHLRWALVATTVALDVFVVTASARSVYDTVEESAPYSRYWRTHGPLGRWDFAAEVSQTGPLPKVVLSDPDTSYLMPYFLGSFVLTMPFGHAPPFVNHRIRQMPVWRVYAGAVRPEIVSILQRHHVNAIIVAPDKPWPQPDAGRRMLGRLRRYAGFEVTGCCGKLVLVRYTDGTGHP